MDESLPHELPPFSIRISDSGDARVVAPQGELDLLTGDQLGAALGAADGARTVIDFREVTFIDSSGISVLLQAAREAEIVGGRLACIEGPPEVHRVLQITGIDQMLDWVADPAEATSS
jgi:anti-anti-sigma factor